MTLERPNTNLRSKVPLLRDSPIIGANVLELWTIIIRFRMVWILLGNKVAEAGGDKVVGQLGAQPTPAHPFRIRLTICQAVREYSDRSRCDRPIRRIPE